VAIEQSVGGPSHQGLASGGCCPFQDAARFPYNILLDPSLGQICGRLE
jgi:hypothetical protein